MALSAKVGDPPATADDFSIVQFYIRWALENEPAKAENLNPFDGFYLGGPKPADFVSESIENKVLGLGYFTIVLITLLTAARIALPLLARSYKWGWDDTVYIMAAVVGQACNISCLLETYIGGMGVHMYDATYMQLAGLARWSALAQYFYYITLGLIKISLTLFVLRAIGHSSHKWRIFLYTFMGVCGVYTVACTLVQPLALRPWSVYFDVVKAGKEGQKFNFSNFAAVIGSLSILNAALDFILVCIPIVLFFRMKVSIKKKARLMLLFIVGLGTVGTAVGRLKVSATVQFSPDLSWNSAVLTNWGFVEFILSFICANSVMFNAIFVICSERVHSHYSKSKSSKSDFGETIPKHDKCVGPPQISTINAGTTFGRSFIEKGTDLEDIPSLHYLGEDRTPRPSTVDSVKTPGRKFSEFSDGSDGISCKKEVSNDIV